MKKRQIADFESVGYEAVSLNGCVVSLVVSPNGPGRVTMSGEEIVELRDWLNEITGHPTPRLITHDDLHTLLGPGTLTEVESPFPGIKIGHDNGYNGGGQRNVLDETGNKVVEPIPVLDQRGLSAGFVLDAKEIAARKAILAEEALKPHVPDALTVAHLPKIEARLKAEGMEFIDMSDK